MGVTAYFSCIVVIYVRFKGYNGGLARGQVDLLSSSCMGLEPALGITERTYLR